MDQLTEVSRNETRTRSKDWERRQLPENPDNQTFRGRYQHLDRKVLELMGVEKLPVGSTIRVLDYAGGVLPFGSPTAHDLFDTIQEAGQSPEIKVVDRNIPSDLKPNYPEIAYSDSLKVDGEQYDIVRVLHLIEHVSPEEYERIHQELEGKLRGGGFFISTQELYYKRDDPEDWGEKRISGSNMKIMQKRNGKLIPIALLPDAFTKFKYKSADPHEKQRRYQEYRDKLQKGEVSLDWGIDYESLDRALTALNYNVSQGLEALSSDHSEVVTNTENKGDVLALLRRNQQDASDRFAAGKRLMLAAHA